MERKQTFSKILIIQTAFIGDVVLATGLIEKIYDFYPKATIDFLVRKGNEGLLLEHPKLNQVLIWEKKGGKYRNLFRIIGRVRGSRYDLIVNCQRFFSSGLITVLGAHGALTSGFKKNPLSMFYDMVHDHQIDPALAVHEVERNHQLISFFTDKKAGLPRLYPPQAAYEKIVPFIEQPFVCLAPASVWKTKQLPESKWVDLINSINEGIRIYTVGSASDKELCSRIIERSERGNIEDLCGELSLIESSALFEKAERVYVNDSAPLHIGSAMNTPTTAFFCSTIPEFGFGPLAEESTVIELEKGTLPCRPCGIHGRSNCPEGHFKCGEEIIIS